MGFFIKSVEVMFSYTKGRRLEAVQEDVFASCSIYLRENCLWVVCCF